MTTPGRGAEGAEEDGHLVEALRRGDEAAFVTLVERYHQAMLRLAVVYVADRAVAEEVVQEAWLGVLLGLDRFEARSSLRTWIFHILTNRAKTRAQRENRTLPFSALEGAAADEPAVEPERFRSSEPWPGHWALPPRPWDDAPDALLLAEETRDHLRLAIAALPPGQRVVLTLRDVEGWGAAEVSAVLGITAANERVLLHRARSKVRRALERYLGEE